MLLQSDSTLGEDDPGNAAKLIEYTRLLAEAFYRQNPALDVRRADDTACAGSPLIKGMIPVGETWNRAFAAGIATANPYQATAPGQVKLWAQDSYHGGKYGYYLEALVIFGYLTGRDPRSLGHDEPVARELGIAGATAGALQRIAAAQLAAEEPQQLAHRAA